MEILGTASAKLFYWYKAIGAPRNDGGRVSAFCMVSFPAGA